MTRVVKLGDQRPLVLKKESLPGPVVAICRCGLSAAWPLCDGSHAATRTEEEGKLYHYDRSGDEEVLLRHEVEDPDRIPGGVQRTRKPPFEPEGYA